MPSDNLIRMILELEDHFSQEADNAEKMIEKFGNTAQQSNTKASLSSQKLTTTMRSTNQTLTDAARDVRKIGTDGQESFHKLTAAQQDAAIKFNMLDKASQNVLNHINEFGRSGMPGFSAAVEHARSEFDALNGVTRTFAGSLDYSRSKLQLLGADTDSLKGKIQVVGNGIQTYIGTKWDGVKSKVSSLGSFITSTLSNALSTVKSKIESLGSAFDGLGGIISSVFGAIGLNSIQEMTIGLSMNREQVKSLMYATFGAGEATEQLWDAMDNLTTQGVVSLDELTQAMSVIKMSTGATTEQLTEMMPVVNDIGQRAIMMGKSGEEAIQLMQAAGKGLNGEFAMLQDYFGITKEKLMDLGWSGAADDVEGYVAALQSYLDQGGDMSNLLDTTSGKLTSLQKNIRIAGRTIGDQLMPYINMALDALLEMSDPETGNGIAQIALGVAGLAAGFATIAPSITPTLQALDMMWSKGRAVLTFVGLLEAEEGALTAATLANTIAEYANTVAIAAGGTAAVTATGANAGLTASLWAMTTALLANPITWVVLALVALAVAAYEVGKAFGWWHDIPSLLGAVWSGIQRLWNAFTNHPDVQAAIQALSSAWNWLSSAIGSAWKAIQQFFGQFGGGEFDAVHAIIVSIGVAWQMITFPIRTVISAVQYLIGIFKNAQSSLSNFGNNILLILGPIGWVIAGIQSLSNALGGSAGGLGEVLGTLQNVFTTVWQTINALVGGVVGPLIDMFRDLYNTFVDLWNGQITLGEAMNSIWGTISSNILEILNNVEETVVNFALTVADWALQAGQSFFTNLWNSFSKIPGMVYNSLVSAWNWITTVGVQWAMAGLRAAANFIMNVNNQMMMLPLKVGLYLAQVLSKILSAGSQWVSSAISKASQVVQGVISQVSQLPGKVYNEFIKIGQKIRDSINSAVRAATQFGSDVVNAVLGALGIASPGTIQRKTVAEFMNTIQRIAETSSSAYAAGKKVGENIVNGFGDVDLESNMDSILNPMNNSITSWSSLGIENGGTYTIENNNTFDGEVTIVHDLSNVPEGMDEEKLIEILNKSTNEDSFMKKIAESVSFQKYDSREKLKINRRNGRSKGVLL